jgi:hypothetical protein
MDKKYQLNISCMFIYYSFVTGNKQKMSKRCNACNEIKSLTDFEAGRACCKVCRGKKVAEARRNRRGPVIIPNLQQQPHAVPVNPNIDITYDTLIPDDKRHQMQLLGQELNILYLRPLSEDDMLDEIMRLTQEIFMIANEIATGDVYLSFPLAVSPITHKFLKLVYADNGNFRTAKQYLRTQDKTRFENKFGLEYDAVSFDEIVELEKATDYIRTMYDAMVRDRVFDEDDPNQASMKYTIVTFDPMRRSVVFSSNPLRFTRDDFMKAVHEMENSDHVTIQMYKKAGYLEQFKKMGIA